MKAGTLREMSVEELHAKVEELQEEGFNLRFQHKMGQLSNPIRLRQVRREIAQVNTVLRENDLGLIQLPSKEQTGE